LFEFLFIKNFRSWERAHITWELGISASLGNSQMSFQSGHESFHKDCVKTLFKWTVFINELSGLNLISNMEISDSLANVLNRLDDLGSGWSGSKHVDVLKFLFKEEFASICSVDEGTSLRFDSNFVLLGLFGLLGKKTVFLDGESFFHRL
jgi:hypothetical protein